MCSGAGGGERGGGTQAQMHYGYARHMTFDYCLLVCEVQSPTSPLTVCRSVDVIHVHARRHQQVPQFKFHFCQSDPPHSAPVPSLLTLMPVLLPSGLQLSAFLAVSLVVCLNVLPSPGLGPVSHAHHFAGVDILVTDDTVPLILPCSSSTSCRFTL